ncbi:MAG: hypothetical protein ACLFTT_08945 [Candidatus Hydrogenedentota bacterium]
MLAPFACAFLIPLLALSDAAPAAHALPPEEPAKAVLVAPVHLTWAANHVDHWQEIGVDGFAVMGVLESWGDNPWARDGRPHSMGEDDLLLRELRHAHRRLADAGIAENFLYLPLRPAAPWLAQDKAARALMRALGEAADFVRHVGLRGLLIDVDATGLVFDHRWDGYTPEARDYDTLAGAAKKLGRRALTAMAAAHPDLRIALLVDSIDDASPLWFPFMEGLVAGIGAADSLQIDLFTRESRYTTAPAALARQHGQIMARVQQRLPLIDQHHWKQFGGIALGLRPLGYDNDGAPVRFYTPGELRVQVAAAKALCARYVWIDAPLQAWWQMTSGEAPQYGGLYQMDGAVTKQTRPIAANLSAYALNTPFDRMRRVGPLPSHNAMVYRGEAGAAAFFFDTPSGTFAAAPAAGNVSLTHVASGAQTRGSGTGGAAALQDLPPGPVVAYPLDDAGWTLPAAMWLEPTRPLTESLRHRRLHFGIRNPLQTTLIGRLQATPPSAFGLGHASRSLDLAPGAHAAMTRTLQGVFALAPDYAFTVTLSWPEAPEATAQTVARRFTLPVLPQALTTDYLDAAPLRGPARAWAGSAEHLLVVTSPRDVRAYSTTGSHRWTYRPPRRLATPAIPAWGRGSERLLVALGAEGKLHRLTPDGKAAAPISTDIAPGGVLCAARLFESPASVLLAAIEPEGIAALTPDGARLWTQPNAGPVRFMALTGAKGEDMPALVAARTRPGLVALSRKGDIAWKAETIGPVSCPPVLLPEVSELVVGTVHGHVQTFSLADGANKNPARLPVNDPVTALAAANWRENGGGPAWFAANAHTIYAFGGDGRVMWEAPQRNVKTLHPAWFAGQPMLLAGGADELCAYTAAAGTVYWRDNRAAGAVHHPIVTVPGASPRNTALWYAAGDRGVRLLDLGPQTHPRTVSLDDFALPGPKDAASPLSTPNTPFVPPLP